MKIIPQSFEPIVHTKDYVANIASAARLCYKSEDKAKADETPFVNGLVKGGHNSTLEMSVLHLEITTAGFDEVIDLIDSNYIITDVTGAIGTLYCTASIRAWREFILKPRISNMLTLCITDWLIRNIAEVFTKDLLTDYLRKKFPNFAVNLSNVTTNPINYFN